MKETLSYATALKLKEAGFPQEYRKTEPVMDFAYDKGETLHLLHDDNDTGWWLGNDYSTHPDDETVAIEFVKCPTLSELIAECGADFVSLTYLCHPAVHPNQWQVRGTSKGGTGYNESNKPVITEGSTPEEAVAHLWIELNKK